MLKQANSINVICKNKQTEKKHHAFSCTAGVRHTSRTKLITLINKVHLIFAPTNFSDPTSSFAAGDYCKFVENATMAQSRVNAYNWIVCPPKATTPKT